MTTVFENVDGICPSNWQVAKVFSGNLEKVTA